MKYLQKSIPTGELNMDKTKKCNIIGSIIFCAMVVLLFYVTLT